MKKPLKFLALVLSSLTLASNAGFVRAAGPETSTETSSKPSLPLINLVDFKNKTLSHAQIIKFKLCDMCIKKEEVKSVYDQHLPEKFEFLKTFCSSTMSPITDDFESFNIIMSLKKVMDTSKPEKEDLISFLYIANMKKMEIPDVLNFNSIEIDWNRKDGVIFFKQGEKPVFGIIMHIK